LVNYTFLTDFNLLQTTSSICAWAIPVARQLLDSYYKLQRAREEIQWLNIEIHQFVTYMKDEQGRRILYWHNCWGRFDDVHWKWLQATKNKLGPAFTGTLQPGIWVIATSATIARS
ncbi:hypothetical protein K438DRAFT_1556860, partial [Mycena galopus ATCC 62051]